MWRYPGIRYTEYRDTGIGGPTYGGNLGVWQYLAQAQVPDGAWVTALQDTALGDTGLGLWWSVGCDSLG